MPNPKKRRTVRQRARLSPVYAKHTGWCFRCHDQFAAGDPIYARNGEWAHRKCAPGAEDE